MHPPRNRNESPPRPSSLVLARACYKVNGRKTIQPPLSAMLRHKRNIFCPSDSGIAGLVGLRVWRLQGKRPPFAGLVSHLSTMRIHAEQGLSVRYRMESLQFQTVEAFAGALKLKQTLIAISSLSRIRASKTRVSNVSRTHSQRAPDPDFLDPHHFRPSQNERGSSRPSTFLGNMAPGRASAGLPGHTDQVKRLTLINSP